MGYSHHSTSIVSSSDNFVIANTQLTNVINGVRVGFIKISTDSGASFPIKFLVTILSVLIQQHLLMKLKLTRKFKIWQFSINLNVSFLLFSNRFDTIVMAPRLVAASTSLLQFKINKAFSPVGAGKSFFSFLSSSISFC